jgi:hypothetical protein
VSWSLYRWTWQLEAPLFVGTAPAESLNRCRLYVPARALWGALTAELARREVEAFPPYEEVGRSLRENARFTYLYPAAPQAEAWRAWLPRYEPAKGLVWRPEDRSEDAEDLRDRSMRMRLLGTRPATAIDPSSDTAADGSLRETECINTHWRAYGAAAGSPVAFVGYVFLRDASLEIRAADALDVGGDTRYGLGRLRRIDIQEATTVFGAAAELDAHGPIIRSAVVLAHARAAGHDGVRLRGQQEALAGWDRGKPGVQQIAEALWVPGSVSEHPIPWLVGQGGLWQGEAHT